MSELKIVNKIDKYLPACITLAMLVIPFCAEAVKQDDLQAVTTEASNYITGNLSRIIMLVGVLTGAVVSFIKSSLVVLGIFTGIGVGSGLLIKFITTTYAYII